MSRVRLRWHERPGLAGGIDKDGTRAEELLNLGFGSVEFGTVAAHPQAPFSVAALARRLAALPRGAGRSAIGIGIGLPPGAAPAALPGLWLAGFLDASPVADYVSFNLSAQAAQPLLAREHLPLLGAAMKSITAARDCLPRRIALALKFPLGMHGEPLPEVAEAAAQAGFDALTVVLPTADGHVARLARFAALTDRIADGPALVAVGGIRTAVDVSAARAAGAAGVQVHRAFVDDGPDCLRALTGASGARPRTAVLSR
ncbi:hypothetical protein PA01_06175 [Azoarcus sp. PA01]|nr:hypothetical protein PA01_06175 [Azoarcus sp. PA01]